MAASSDLQTLSQSINPKDYRSTMLCLVRSTTDDEVEASLDLGETWDRLPLDELTGAEVVKQVEMPDAAYDLVRLFLKEPHPTIELVALSAQVRLMKDPPTERGHCMYLCHESPYTKHGTAFVNCVFWCAFLR